MVWSFLIAAAALKKHPREMVITPKASISPTFPSVSFHPPLCECGCDKRCEKGLRGRARCVVPDVSADVAIAAWLGRALAVVVRKLMGGLDV